VAAGSVAVATVLTIPGDETTVSAARAAPVRSEVAASAWNGLAVVRIVAQEAMWLRHDLAAVLTAMGVRLPRLWVH
jgi:hypothetical protein